jgi:hypothetical protein
MKQEEMLMELVINLQEVDQPLVQQLHEQAAKLDTSLDALVLNLLRLGLLAAQSKSQPQTYHDLDDLAGTWDAQDAESFERAVADLETIDEELWS